MSTIPLEQHRELGTALKSLRGRLLDSPRSAGVSNERAALALVDRLKDKLDNIVCRDFPECADAHQIYYGTAD